MDDEKFERAVGALDEIENQAQYVPDGQEEARFHRAVQGGTYGGVNSATMSLNRRLAPGDLVGALAGDLLETAICEAMPPEEIVRTARACREAAEIAYGVNRDGLPGPDYWYWLRGQRADLGHGIDPNGFIDPGVEGDPLAAEESPVSDPNFARDWLAEDAAIPPPPAAVEGARTVIGGETDGIPFRAHFDGKPSAEQRAALDDLVRAVHADMVRHPGPELRVSAADRTHYEKPWPDPPTVSDREEP